MMVKVMVKDTKNSKIKLITTNKNKFEEAKKILREFNIKLEMLKHKKYEIQSEKIEEIASLSAIESSKVLGIHLITEDSGLFIQALNDFPGPYSSYVYDTIGCKGILDLMRDQIDRKARFKTVVAYCEKKQKSKCFVGIVEGIIAKESKGSMGFGFDPIFIPSRGNGQTFAKMTIEIKNLYSHRAQAFKRFGRWFRYRRTLK